MTRYRCTSCQAISTEKEVLSAINPFDSTDYVTGCPKCMSVDNFENVCDEPGCDRTGNCGWPSDAGYRRTCGEHYAYKG